ncbi:hypothetical protein P3S67_001385 [Capsicum chacoense]
MESDQFSPRKLHYDISMSKRTRKPLNVNAASDERKYERKSLKQLMIEVGSISLRQHLKEDEEHQLQQPQERSINGFKFKDIVRLLCHVIKRKKKHAGYRIQLQLENSKA